jgi:hypothetical protein
VRVRILVLGIVVDGDIHGVPERERRAREYADQGGPFAPRQFPRNSELDLLGRRASFRRSAASTAFQSFARSAIQAGAPAGSMMRVNTTSRRPPKALARSSASLTSQRGRRQQR